MRLLKVSDYGFCASVGFVYYDVDNQMLSIVMHLSCAIYKDYLIFYRKYIMTYK